MQVSQRYHEPSRRALASSGQRKHTQTASPLRMELPSTRIRQETIETTDQMTGDVTGQTTGKMTVSGCWAGEHPFDQDAGVADLFQKITAGAYTFRPDIWGDISPEAQDLIRCMMTVCSPYSSSIPPMSAMLIHTQAHSRVYSSPPCSSPPHTRAHVLTFRAQAARPMNIIQNIQCLYFESNLSV